MVENVEKPMSEVDLSKEMRTSPAMHLSDCRKGEAPINDDVNVEKGETSSAAVIVAVLIPDNLQEGSGVAILESNGSKGSVQINGIMVKKNISCVLNSSDEVVFGSLGNHAYLMTEVVVKGPEVQNSIGMFLQLERSGDPSVVTEATILASLSSLRPDLSH
ncbi:ATPase family AAA domain-containing protein 1-A isoform 2 [Gossypium australe]|uniref:ATPase family AAA domain-containing protein 1-A isoform 2 n=1 Tax=Gossypium australe TaxID=47621 RepID=A0A5B6WI11_9ROSI|nr:ATPase family AAA domain-containing protein 1-A isoform 2 [Gossypium australe]